MGSFPQRKFQSPTWPSRTPYAARNHRARLCDTVDGKSERLNPNVRNSNDKKPAAIRRLRHSNMANMAVHWDVGDT